MSRGMTGADSESGIPGPRGEILYKFIGENNIDRLVAYTKIFVNYFRSKDEITNSKPLPLKLLKNQPSLGEMSSPSRVALDKVGKVYAVADSANHRVLVLEQESNRVQVS